MKSNLKKIKTSEGYMWTEVVDLDNMVGNMLAITTTFDEVQYVYEKNKILVIDGTNRTATNDCKEENIIHQVLFY